MYYNANIHWQPGMELTSRVFDHQQRDIDNRQQLLLRAVMGNVGMGILPMYPLHVEGNFVGNTFEMNNLKLTALLPSGAVISVDDDLKLTIVSKPAQECFVCIGLANGQTRTFERDGIPYKAPVYELSLHPLIDLEAQDKPSSSGQEHNDGCFDVLPLKRFYIEGGSLNVDASYVPPMVSTASHKAFGEFVGMYVELLTKLTAHRNMEEGDCKRTLLHLRFQLQGLTGQESVTELVRRLREVEQALDYHIRLGLGGQREPARELAADPRRTPCMNHIRAYLSWLGEFMNALLLFMDDVVVESHTIDVETLKRELHTQLLEELRQELGEKLSMKLHDEVVPELTAAIMEKLQAHVNDRLRPELKENLYEALHDGLYHDLYEALLDVLSGFMTKEEQQPEDIFTPLI